MLLLIEEQIRFASKRFVSPKVVEMFRLNTKVEPAAALIGGLAMPPANPGVPEEPPSRADWSTMNSAPQNQR
jgi:hypothetical protein